MPYMHISGIRINVQTTSEFPTLNVRDRSISLGLSLVSGGMLLHLLKPRMKNMKWSWLAAKLTGSLLEVGVTHLLDRTRKHVNDGSFLVGKVSPLTQICELIAFY